MKTLNKPWVQAAIDVMDISDAREMAHMALEAGADWIEAGTPLLYFQSVASIKEVVEVAGSVPVVADFKAQDGVYKYFAKAAEYGAAYAVVLGVCDDGSVCEAIRAGKEHGIKVIADLFSVKMAELALRAKELETLGVDAVYVHFGFDQSKYDKVRKPYDGVREVYEAVEIPVGVSAFDLEGALEGIRRGASWVCVGAPVFVKGNLNEFKAFVEAVKSAR